MVVEKNYPYQVGELIRLKKTHACGGTVWRILRVGMDFRLECTNCGRQILLPRSEVNRRVKDIVPK